MTVRVLFHCLVETNCNMEHLLLLAVSIRIILLCASENNRMKALARRKQMVLLSVQINVRKIR